MELPEGGLARAPERHDPGGDERNRQERGTELKPLGQGVVVDPPAHEREPRRERGAGLGIRHEDRDVQQLHDHLAGKEQHQRAPEHRAPGQRPVLPEQPCGRALQPPRSA